MEFLQFQLDMQSFVPGENIQKKAKWALLENILQEFVNTIIILLNFFKTPFFFNGSLKVLFVFC